MRSYDDCIPCLFLQALHIVEMGARESRPSQGRLMRRVERLLDEMDTSDPPPALAQRVHRLVREDLGDPDPYRDLKKRFTNLALTCYPQLRAQVRSTITPLETAVRFAIAGNIIDCGANSRLAEQDVHDAVACACSLPLRGSIPDFADAIAGAERILYLADNAGEVVFDRLLIELLPAEKVKVAVRGAPVINDATMEDARAAGLDRIVDVVGNGSDAPGTLLADCSEEFMERFNTADLIIAKGQGNYETLSETDRNVFFLLKVKCPVIARDIGQSLGSMVLQRATAGRTAGGGGEHCAWF